MKTINGASSPSIQFLNYLKFPVFILLVLFAVLSVSKGLHCNPEVVSTATIGGQGAPSNPNPLGYVPSSVAIPVDNHLPDDQAVVKYSDCGIMLETVMSPEPKFRNKGMNDIEPDNFDIGGQSPPKNEIGGGQSVPRELFFKTSEL